MKLQIFNGGLATRTRPQYIGVEQSIVCDNVDLSAGSLVAVKDKKVTDITVAKYNYFYEAEQQWLGSSTETDYVEYKGIVYSTDGIKPKKYNGTTSSNLGIAKPTTKPIVVASSTLDTVTDITVTPASGGTIPVGLDYYVLVNVDGSVYSNALFLSVDARGKVTTINESSSNPPAPSIVETDTGTTRQVTIENPVGITIGADGVEVYRLYEGTYRRVGVLATATSSLVDSVADISANAELNYDNFGALQGTYQYVLTFVNTADGTESGPSPVSNEVEVSGKVTLSSLQVSTDTQVDKRYLYRVGGNSTQFTRVVELDNALTAYIDEIPDAELEGTILETSDFAPPPSGLKFITEAYAMLFGADGTNLRFTPIDQPNSWPELFSIDFPLPITGIAPVATGVLIFTKFKTYLITGTGPNTLSRQLLRSDQGCLSHRSVQTIEGAAIWASTDGLCMSNGNNVEVITKNALGKLELTPQDSVLHDEIYYLINEDSILAADFRYGLRFSTYTLGVDTLTVANDVLYGWSNNKFYEMFASDNSLSFSYKSPRFIEGLVSEFKTYKKIYIYSKGDIIIKIIIDDIVTFSRVISGEGITQVQIPQSEQRGAFIQFELSGTGEVYELEYQAGRRQNE